MNNKIIFRLSASEEIDREKHIFLMSNPLEIKWDSNFIPRVGEWLEDDIINIDRFPGDIQDEFIDAMWEVFAVGYHKIKGRITPVIDLVGHT